MTGWTTKKAEVRERKVCGLSCVWREWARDALSLPELISLIESAYMEHKNICVLSGKLISLFFGSIRNTLILDRNFWMRGSDNSEQTIVSVDFDDQREQPKL